MSYDTSKVKVFVSGKTRESSKFTIKFMTSNMTWGQFIPYIRTAIKNKQIVIKPTEALFLLIDGKNIPPMSEYLHTSHNLYKDENGVMNVELLLENTFGNF